MQKIFPQIFQDLLPKAPMTARLGNAATVHEALRSQRCKQTLQYHHIELCQQDHDLNYLDILKENCILIRETISLLLL